MRSFYNEAWALSSVRQLEDRCLFIFVNLIPACAEKLPSDGSLGLHQRQADPPCPKQILPGGISAPGIEVFLQDLIIEQIRASVHKAGVSRIELPQDQGTPVIAIEERARLEMQENAINMAREHPEDVAQLIRTWLMEE